MYVDISGFVLTKILSSWDWRELTVLYLYNNYTYLLTNHIGSRLRCSPVYRQGRTKVCVCVSQRLTNLTGFVWKTSDFVVGFGNKKSLVVLQTCVALFSTNQLRCWLRLLLLYAK